MLKSLINNFNSVAKLYAYKHFLPWWAFEYHRKKIQGGAGPPPYIYLLVEVLLFVKLFSNLNLDVNWAIGGHFKLYTTNGRSSTLVSKGMQNLQGIRSYCSYAPSTSVHSAWTWGVLSMISRNKTTLHYVQLILLSYAFCQEFLCT